MRLQELRGWVVPLGLFLAAGCSGAEGDMGRAEVYETSGIVTLDGKPVSDADVTFAPKGQHPAAVGRTDVSGRYSLTTYEAGDGAAAGDYSVMVVKQVAVTTGSPTPHEVGSSGSKSSGNIAASHAQAAKQAKSEIPKRYSSPDESGLTATVKEGGENKFDFALTP